MAKRHHRIFSYGYILLTTMIICGGTFWALHWETAQHTAAVAKAFGRHDFAQVMVLEHLHDADQLWLTLLMLTWVVATDANVPLVPKLDQMGWDKAFRGWRYWLIAQGVTFALLGQRFFQRADTPLDQRLSVITGLSIAVISLIDVVYWLHAQKYRNFYRDPANYLITR